MVGRKRLAGTQKPTKVLQKKRKTGEEDNEEEIEVDDGDLPVEDKARLIDEVRKYPAIWNIKSKGYRDSQQSANSWAAISLVLEIEGRTISCFPKLIIKDYYVAVKLCKETWQSLRKYYSKIYGKYVLATRSGAGFVPQPSWPLYESMRFIQDSLECNRFIHYIVHCVNANLYFSTLSNVPAPQSNNSFDEDDKTADRQTLISSQDSLAEEGVGAGIFFVPPTYWVFPNIRIPINLEDKVLVIKNWELNMWAPSYLENDMLR